MQNQQETFANNISILEARWLVICLIVILPMWIWPSEIEQLFLNLSFSILQAIGWVVGIAAAVIVSSIGFSAFARAMLKQNHQTSKSVRS